MIALGWLVYALDRDQAYVTQVELEVPNSELAAAARIPITILAQAQRLAVGDGGRAGVPGPTSLRQRSLDPAG